jgi:hypothetical protein
LETTGSWIRLPLQRHDIIVWRLREPSKKVGLNGISGMVRRLTSGCRTKCANYLDLSGDEVQQIQEAISEAAKRITEASRADEPPGPTDDFYFLYCIANRLVKVCDWEDAGDTNIELR